MNDVTIYAQKDFLNSTAPFEEVYKLIGNKFELERSLITMSAHAKMCGVGNFRKMFKDYCNMIKQNSSPDYTENASNFEGQELELNTGDWQADDFGITKYGQFGEVVACPHPIMPVMRLSNIDTGIERIKIAYKKGKGWRSQIVERNIISSSNKIIALSDYGVAVTSENSRDLVNYLHDVENLNYEKIPECNSVGRLGWINGEGFSPYVENLIFDGDLSFKHYFDAVGTKGKESKWMALAKDIRKQGSIPARIMLAASFASVLVEPCSAQTFFCHLWGGTETGKPQPISTTIITPYGVKTMGEMEVGDEVIGCDGMPHKVTGVYPKGVKHIYELTFKDGTKSRCSKDHLWSVKTLTRKEHNRGFKVMTLEEMMELPLKKSGYNLRIPINKPVHYKGEQNLPINPYLLGVLIGDGCIGSNDIYISNQENDIMDKASILLGIRGCTLKTASSIIRHDIKGDGKKQLIDDIASLSLNVNGCDKFIPKCYLLADIESRHELLAGLFDTDGSVNLSGSFTYSTASENLANDVASLCRSLGYRPTVSFKNRIGQEYQTAGKTYTRKSLEYTVRIPTKDKIFTSEKHCQRYEISISNKGKGYLQLNDDLPIVSIEPCGEEECQCIMVDSNEHTYLCDDFIVTHNTVGLMLAASVWANPEMGKYIHTFNSTAVAQELSAGFVNSLPLILDELQIVKEKKDFDNMIYQLSEGVGKNRGAKLGGLQKVATWSNCILTTGEQPISNSSSGGGAVNRIIEINCEDTKLFDDPAMVVDIVKANYGFAGKEFVEALSIAENMEMARGIQKSIYKGLSTSNDITEKQSLAASLILAADQLINYFIFDDGVELDFKDIVPFLSSKDEVSVNHRAYEWLFGWLAQNMNKFTITEFSNDIWGTADAEYIYIIGNVFDSACSENGFNPHSFLSWMKRKGYIDTEDKRLKRQKKVGNLSPRCVFLKKMTE